MPKREKRATMAQPDPNSKRSRRRKNRGFKNLELSSRKHRRANKRQDSARVFNGADHKPGEKANCASGPNPRRAWLYTAGGAINFW
jgi:hypothetical protein